MSLTGRLRECPVWLDADQIAPAFIGLRHSTTALFTRCAKLRPEVSHWILGNYFPAPQSREQLKSSVFVQKSGSSSMQPEHSISAVRQARATRFIVNHLGSSLQEA